MAEKKKSENTFIDGVMWAAQFMAISHGEETYAMHILRDSGFSRSELMKAQKKTEYENRRMNKIIREAVYERTQN